MKLATDMQQVLIYGTCDFISKLPKRRK